SGSAGGCESGWGGPREAGWRVARVWTIPPGPHPPAARDPSRGRGHAAETHGGRTMKRIPLFVVLAVGVLAADMAMAKAADRSMTRSSSRETTKSDFRLNALGASAAFVSPQDLDGT